MMREIKLRAYIKDLKKVVDVREIDLVYKYITFRLDDKAKGENRTFDQIELMQFTGLYDKNGKEIYENDIIRCKSGDLQVVEYHTELLPNKVSYASDFGCRNIKNFDVYWAIDITDEVIGNIFDNPELLEEDDE